MNLETTTSEETGDTLITYYHEGVSEVWTAQEAFDLGVSLMQMALAINEEMTLIQALQEAGIQEENIMQTINLWRNKRMENEDNG